MFKVTKYPHGTFSWADNSSHDQDKARDFYSKLFGWEADIIPISDSDTYTMFRQGDAHTAGLGGMEDAVKATGVPSHWMSYITVDNVDELVDKVTAIGGKVVAGPYDVFDSGRMMVIQDTGGANVSLWQPNKHIGAGVVNAPGAMIWNELATRDVDNAKDFYGKLFGWQFKTDENNYTLIDNNGRMNGGIMQIDESWGDAPSNWMVYFNVADLDAALKTVEEQGGKIEMRHDTADVGPFAIIMDPVGAAMTLMQAKQADSWQE